MTPSVQHVTDKIDYILQSILEKIDTLSDGTKSSTAELVASIYGHFNFEDGIYCYKEFSITSKEYFTLHAALLREAKKREICLDASPWAGIPMGLPFHCPFIIRKGKESLASDGNIIQLPEYDALKRDVEKLRTELSMLILERDHLRLVECKNLETAYMLALGALEHKAYESQCLTLRLKRKIEMLQAKRNRQEKIVLAEIEQALDAEFAEYQQRLNEQIEKMNQAIEHSKGKFLTPEETKECRKLYRAIVKSLHPDLHPDLTEAERQMFHNAVQAYEHGDLETLRVIHAMSEKPALPDAHEDAMKVLLREKERLEKAVAAIQNDMRDIKAEFPYTMKELLSDERIMNEKKRELEAIIKEYQEMAAHYQERINEMVR